MDEAPLKWYVTVPVIIVTLIVMTMFLRNHIFGPNESSQPQTLNQRITPTHQAAEEESLHKDGITIQVAESEIADKQSELSLYRELVNVKSISEAITIFESLSEPETLMEVAFYIQGQCNLSDNLFSGESGEILDERLKGQDWIRDTLVQYCDQPISAEDFSRIAHENQRGYPTRPAKLANKLIHAMGNERVNLTINSLVNATSPVTLATAGGSIKYDYRLYKNITKNPFLLEEWIPEKLVSEIYSAATQLFSCQVFSDCGSGSIRMITPCLSGLCERYWSLPDYIQATNSPLVYEKALNIADRLWAMRDPRLKQ